MSFLKQANNDDLKQAAALMESVYNENPKAWPHGLTTSHFAPGNIWLIHKNASEAPVGFVAWQTRKEDHMKVGYYSVGILPEYRRQGVASAAISQLLEKRARAVDIVKAAVVEGNVASEKLAESLQVPIKLMKQAGGKLDLLKFLGSRAAGGAANAATWDYMNPHREQGNATPFSGEWTAGRTLNTLLNFGLGAGGVHSMARGGAMRKDLGVMHKDLAALSPRSTAKATALKGDISVLKGDIFKNTARTGALFSAAVPKDLMITATEGIRTAHEIPEALRALAASKGQGLAAGLAKVTEGRSPWEILAGATLLAGGVGAAGWGISKAIQNQKPLEVNMGDPKGRVKVTLPTMREGDAETVLDLPFDQSEILSNALQHRLAIDTRRRLRSEVTQRKKPRGTIYDTQVA